VSERFAGGSEVSTGAARWGAGPPSANLNPAHRRAFHDAFIYFYRVCVLPEYWGKGSKVFDGGVGLGWAILVVAMFWAYVAVNKEGTRSV
jgi:hypothetical protein